MPRRDTALHAFSQGCSCSQAVLTCFAAEAGLDQARAMRLAAGFGGGMGRTGGTCGVVTGAVMVLGLMYGHTRPSQHEAKEHVYAQVQNFIRCFTGRNKSIFCRELLGCDIGRPEGLEKAKSQRLFITLCPKYVGDAVEILEQMMEESPPNLR